MALKFIDKSSGKVVEKPVRNLIVNGVEKYRLEIRTTGSHKINSTPSDSLVYAKGKINFDLNFPKDGSGNDSIKEYFNNLTDELIVPSSLYAFYKEGFFRKGGTFLSNNTVIHLGDSIFYKDTKANASLKTLITDWISPPIWEGEYCPATFEGWWTVKANTGGKKIDNIDDVYKKTELFNYKKSSALPEITLYARWKIKTFSLTVKNITRKRQKSYFTYKDQDTKKWIKTTGSYRFKNLLWGTNIQEFLKQNVKDIKYITWAKNVFSNNEKENQLRRGPQNFLGWVSSEEGRPAYSRITRNVSMCPFFEALFIFRSGRTFWGESVPEEYFCYKPNHLINGYTQNIYTILIDKKGRSWIDRYSPNWDKQRPDPDRRGEYKNWNNNPINAGTYIFKY